MGWQRVADVSGLVIVQSGKPNTGLFVYQGKPAAGNPPVFSVVAPGTTSDPFGNAVKPLLATRDPATGAYIDINGNTILVGSTQADPGFSLTGGGGALTINGGVTGIPGDVQLRINVSSRDESAGPQAQAVVGEATASAVTGAMWEVQGNNGPGIYAAVSHNGEIAYMLQRAAELSPRFRILDPGVLQWGTAADTELYRASAGVLASSFTAFDNAGAAETPQAFAFTGGWAQKAGRVTSQYLRVPGAGDGQGAVLVMGSVTVPAGPPAFPSAIITAAAAAYRPNNVQSLVAYNVTTAGIVRLTWNTGGVLSANQNLVSAIAAGDNLDIPPQLVFLNN